MQIILSLLIEDPVYTLFTLLLDRAESDLIWLQYNGVVRGTFRLWNKLSIIFKTTDLFSWNAIRSLGAFYTFLSPFFALSSIPATRNGSSCIDVFDEHTLSGSSDQQRCAVRLKGLPKRVFGATINPWSYSTTNMRHFPGIWAYSLTVGELGSLAAILLGSEGPGMSFM